MKTVLRQGESIEIDYPISSGTIPAGMEATWVIMQKGTAILNDTLDKSADQTSFELRILDTDTVSLLGKYVLYVAAVTPLSNQKSYIHVEELVFKEVV